MIDQIAKSADVSKAAAGRALDATVAAIKTAMKKGGMVTLVGFGTFYVASVRRATGAIRVPAPASRSKPHGCRNSVLAKR
jgi:nucleoid DNA-binding protein